MKPNKQVLRFLHCRNNTYIPLYIVKDKKPKQEFPDGTSSFQTAMKKIQYYVPVTEFEFIDNY